MRPEFIVNDHGVRFCKSHPKYQAFSDSVSELHNLQDQQLKATRFHETRRIWHQVESCTTCDHYIQNHCYFSPRRIKVIRVKTKLQMYRCKLCGSAIDRVYDILYKKVSKKKDNVEIPLICRLCYLSLHSDNMKKEFRTQRRSFLIWSITLLVISLIPAYVFFRISFEEYFPISILVIVAFIIFFSWSILEFIKILKLKISLKKSKFFKAFLETQNSSKDN